MAKKTSKIQVVGLSVGISSSHQDDFISITDIAKYKNPDAPADIIKNWMRSKNTIELLGIWEKLNNSAFKLVEFDQFRNEAGLNHFVLWRGMFARSIPSPEGATEIHESIAPSGLGIYFGCLPSRKRLG